MHLKHNTTLFLESGLLSLNESNEFHRIISQSREVLSSCKEDVVKNVLLFKMKIRIPGMRQMDLRIYWTRHMGCWCM